MLLRLSGTELCLPLCRSRKRRGICELTREASQWYFKTEKAGRQRKNQPVLRITDPRSSACWCCLVVHDIFGATVIGHAPHQEIEK